MYEGTKWLKTLINVLTVTWFNQDLHKVLCEVVPADDALFPGNVFFTYTQVYKFNGGSCAVLTSLILKPTRLHMLL